MHLKFRHTFYIALLAGMFGACHSGHTADNAQADTLRVMTYNIHHANPPSKAKDSVIDLQAIADVINKVKPDLVALQEIDVHNRRAGMQVNEAATLAHLTGMHYHFTRAIYYRGGEYGDAVLSRFPIEDSMDYHLPIAEGAKEELRTLCMIKVMLPGDKSLLFASTHLGLSQPSRMLQAKKIIDIVKTKALPVIIGGDFNARPHSNVIRLLDSTMTRSDKANGRFTIPAGHPSHKIDYIMYHPADNFNTLHQEVIHETYASDHLPVVVTLTVR